MSKLKPFINGDHKALDLKRERYLHDLEFYNKSPQDSHFLLMVAICYTKLENYLEAKSNYTAALRVQGKAGYLFFPFIGMIEKVVEIYVLAGQPDFFHQTVIEQLESYKQDKRRTSLLALYAYALMCFLEGKDQDATAYVPGLLKRPKVKDMFAIGKIIQAIVDRDQTAFDSSLNDLLLAHRGIAKFGELRETPEGFLSLAAMCLVKVAIDRGMTINVENEYLSKGYLDYLLVE